MQNLNIIRQWRREIITHKNEFNIEIYCIAICTFRFDMICTSLAIRSAHSLNKIFYAEKRKYITELSGNINICQNCDERKDVLTDTFAIILIEFHICKSHLQILYAYIIKLTNYMKSKQNI